MSETEFSKQTLDRLSELLDEQEKLDGMLAVESKDPRAALNIRIMRLYIRTKMRVIFDEFSDSDEVAEVAFMIALARYLKEKKLMKTRKKTEALEVQVAPDFLDRLQEYID